MSQRSQREIIYEQNSNDHWRGQRRRPGHRVQTRSTRLARRHHRASRERAPRNHHARRNSCRANLPPRLRCWRCCPIANRHGDNSDVTINGGHRYIDRGKLHRRKGRFRSSRRTTIFAQFPAEIANSRSSRNSPPIWPKDRSSAVQTSQLLTCSLISAVLSAGNSPS